MQSRKRTEVAITLHLQYGGSQSWLSANTQSLRWDRAPFAVTTCHWCFLEVASSGTATLPMPAVVPLISVFLPPHYSSYNFHFKRPADAKKCLPQRATQTSVYKPAQTWHRDFQEQVKWDENTNQMQIFTLGWRSGSSIFHILGRISSV